MTQALTNKLVRIAEKIRQTAKKLYERFMAMSLKKRVMLITAILLTITLCIAIPIVAWFAAQRQAAELYKINYPDSLYINAAHHEDQKYFDLDEITAVDANGIAVTNGKKLYVFAVSGSNVNSYILQLTHTTNNPFTYKIYKATQSSDIPSSELVEGTDYVAHTLSTDSDAYSETEALAFSSLNVKSPTNVTELFYIKRNEVSGEYLNQDDNNTTATKAVTGTNDTYYNNNYNNTDDVQQDAVVLYWQAVITSPNIDETYTNNFCDYYILEISWTTGLTNKETDLVYITVQKKT